MKESAEHRGIIFLLAVARILRVGLAVWGSRVTTPSGLPGIPNL
jgi:hypothetical protein